MPPGNDPTFTDDHGGQPRVDDVIVYLRCTWNFDRGAFGEVGAGTDALTDRAVVCAGGILDR